jgi:hypothetical protein
MKFSANAPILSYCLRIKVLVPENRYEYSSLRISHNVKSSKSSSLHPAGIILNSTRNSIIHHGAFACCARFLRQRNSRRARGPSSLAWKKRRLSTICIGPQTRHQQAQKAPTPARLPGYEWLIKDVAYSSLRDYEALERMD